MSETPETAGKEFLPKYDELLRLLQMEKPARFAELAQTFNTDDDLEAAQKHYYSRHQYAGKILSAARTMWDGLRQEG